MDKSGQCNKRLKTDYFFVAEMLNKIIIIYRVDQESNSETIVIQKNILSASVMLLIAPFTLAIQTVSLASRVNGGKIKEII